MKLTKNQKWILGGALVLGAIMLYRRNQRNNEQTSSARGGWGSPCDCNNDGVYDTENCEQSCDRCCSNPRVKTRSSVGDW